MNFSMELISNYYLCLNYVRQKQENVVCWIRFSTWGNFIVFHIYRVVQLQFLQA